MEVLEGQKNMTEAQPDEKEADYYFDIANPQSTAETIQRIIAIGASN